MSLADWWKRKGFGKNPPSTNDSESADSMFIVIQVDGVTTVMDRDTYDYQQGGQDLPDPAQRDLDELPFTRIRALSGGMFRGQAVDSAVLLDTSAPEAVATFRRCCAIVEGRGAGHCACLGGPTLDLFAGSEHVATIGLQHGHAIRWARWRDDARLQDAEGLTTWLTDCGVHPALLDLLYHNPLAFTGGRVDGWGTDALTLVEQRVLLAEIRYHQEHIDAALTDCDAILGDHPDTARAYALRGDARHSRGELAASVAEYTAAIERGYRSARISFSRAVALDALGESITALVDCTEAISLAPNYADAYNSRAIILMKLARRQEGLADFARAIALRPNWELPFVNRGAFAHINSDLNAAVADYGRAISLIEGRNDHANRHLLGKLYWNRSKVHGDKGDERRAEADRREAARLDPKVNTP